MARRSVNAVGPNLPPSSYGCVVSRDFRHPADLLKVHIRAATLDDAAEIGLVTVSASLASFLGQVPEEDLDFGWTTSDSARGWHRTIASLPADEFLDVAVSEGQLAGFVWASTTTGRSDFTSEVRGLYVRPTKQRRGVGRALLAHAATRLAVAGASSVLIGCVRENPSCAFYRHLAGVEVQRRPQRVDRFETEEILFGWSDLDLLR